MRTLRLSILPLVAIVLAVPFVSSEEPKKEPPVKPVPKTARAEMMAEKLKHAQLLLDGLATNDFEKITKSAQELVIISNKAEFAALKSRDYVLHTNDFRRSLETILKKSKDKNLDGATLAYLDMTRTCVSCHQHTREMRNAALPVSDLPAPLASR